MYWRQDLIYMTIVQCPMAYKVQSFLLRVLREEEEGGPWTLLVIPLHTEPKMTLKESPDLPASAFTFSLWQTVHSFWVNSKSIFMRLPMSTYSVCEDFIGFCSPMLVTTLVGRACWRNYTTCPWFRRGITTSLWPRTFPSCKSLCWETLRGT